MQPTTHHPPHIYLDDTWYIITSSVYGGRRLLQSVGHKDLVRDQLKALAVEFEITWLPGSSWIITATSWSKSMSALN